MNHKPQGPNQVKAAPRDPDVCLNYAVFLEETKGNFIWAK